MVNLFMVSPWKHGCDDFPTIIILFPSYYYYYYCPVELSVTLIFSLAPATTVATACFNVPPTAGSMVIHHSLLGDWASESSSVMFLCVRGHAPGHRKQTCEHNLVSVVPIHLSSEVA